MKHAKNISKILLFLLTTLTLSCSKDDDNSEINPSLIVGEWKLTSWIRNDVELVTNLDCLNHLIITDTQYILYQYWDFEDGNGCVSVAEGAPALQPYIIEGETITFTDGSVTYLFELLALNQTIFKIKETYTEGGETNTEIETYTRQ
tara:strand:- start:25978 stop:26418 length:441 start_codon:yes stop_codon:yes gene_type:complete